MELISSITIEKVTLIGERFYIEKYFRFLGLFITGNVHESSALSPSSTPLPISFSCSAHRPSSFFDVVV